MNMLSDDILPVFNVIQSCAMEIARRNISIDEYAKLHGIPTNIAQSLIALGQEIDELGLLDEQ